MSCGSAEILEKADTARRNRRSRRCLTPYLLLGCLAVVPMSSQAGDVAEQEFAAALHARPSLMHGEALFDDTCIACHGPDGGGQANGGVPAIAAQHPRVVIRQLVDYRHGGRFDLRMEHSTGRHRLVNAQDIADVAAYVGQLPPTQAADTGNGDLVTAGQLVYARVCASCHGDSAMGNASDGVPRLAGQHYDYLLGQMIAVTEARRPAFPAEHALLFQHLQRSDLIGIADYLCRLGPPPPGGGIGPSR